uniref:Uncharacterized protein n=1 Tax=Arundo donax TaxID=35708 RepID=A0A0A9TWA4_ARUDO
MYLKGLLRTFADSTGLKVNFNKSFLVPINLCDQKASHLAHTLGCEVASMLFTYLGLPLGTTRPTIEEYITILNRIEKRMMGINKFLDYSGQLILVNSVFSALSTFYTCTLKLPVTVIEQIDKYRKHCLWDNGDINKKVNV